MPDNKVDLVLHEGAILGHPESDSVAIADGRIAACGRFTELKGLVGPRTHLVRLGGRVVAPGLIDSHLHFLEAASVASGLSVWRCRTLPDLLIGLRAAAGKTPPGNWLRAFGCDEALLRERRGPTRQELDHAVAKSPLRLRHQTLHASWLNSRAIKVLGLEEPAFKPPPGAYMARDANGLLSGFVVGMEEWLTGHLPVVTTAELEARARLFSRELAAAGVTAFTDATVRNGPGEIALFAKFASTDVISQRISLMLGEQHLASVNEARSLAEAAGINLVAVKVMRAAGCDPRQLADLIEFAFASGLDCAFHCTEIDELEDALTAIEWARGPATAGRSFERLCRIEHGGLIMPDYIPRLRALQTWVVTNPGFLYYRGAKYAAEPGLMPHLYPLASLARGAVNLAGGTDAPVTPAKPLAAVAAAMSRTSFEGYELALQEKLSAREALALFTDSAARLARLEAGEVAPNKLADLIVLPKDPLALTAHELMNVAVDMTIIGGRLVYERGRPVVANSAGADLFSA